MIRPDVMHEMAVPKAVSLKTIRSVLTRVKRALPKLIAELVFLRKRYREVELGVIRVPAMIPKVKDVPVRIYLEATIANDAQFNIERMGLARSGRMELVKRTTDVLPNGGAALRGEEIRLKPGPTILLMTIVRESRARSDPGWVATEIERLWNIFGEGIIGHELAHLQLFYNPDDPEGAEHWSREADKATLDEPLSQYHEFKLGEWEANIADIVGTYRRRRGEGIRTVRDLMKIADPAELLWFYTEDERWRERLMSRLRAEGIRIPFE